MFVLIFTKTFSCPFGAKFSSCEVLPVAHCGKAVAIVQKSGTYTKRQKAMKPTVNQTIHSNCQNNLIPTPP